MTDIRSPDSSGHPHLAPIVGEDWALWRWVAVRGSGFSASIPSALAAPSAATAADGMWQIEHEMEGVRDQAVAVLVRELGASGPRAPVLEAIRLLKKGRFSEPQNRPDAASGLRETLRILDDRLTAARAAYRHAFASEQARVTGALCDFATDERIREAMLWQNRHAVHTGADVLIRQSAEGCRNAEQRKHEQLLASYVQRYCLKNDTIGFFGPVGWARIVDEGPALVIRPGKRLLAERNHYFESWAIQAFANVLAQNPRYEPWLVPRRTHVVHIENSTVFPGARRVDLSPDEIALLQRCNGEHTVREIARQLTNGSPADAATERAVLGTLRALRDRQLIALGLAVPVGLRPERTLRRLLERIDDDEARAEAIGGLDELERARTAITLAAGNPDALDSALRDAEEAFTRLTGQAPTRLPGKTYGARTLVYEDCRRDADIRIGPEVLDAIGPPLALVLSSARWLTFETARRYTTALEQLHRGLQREAGSRSIPLPAFLARALPLLVAASAPPAREALEALQQKWESILDVPDGVRSIEYRSSELRARVHAALDAPRPGWQFARYHSPDLMIAAAGAEAVQRGSYLAVLGELHVSSNTIGTPGFLAQHPNPDELQRAAELDLPLPRMEPIMPGGFGQVTARTTPALFSTKDYRLDISVQPTDAGDATVHPVGAFVITDEDDRLVIHTRDRRLEFDVTTVFAHALWRQMTRRFEMLPSRSHRPRITIDRLIVAREYWRIPPQDMPFAFVKDEADRFASARRWARDRAVPRHVFVRAPIEPKPMYVDFDSPILVGIMARIVRRSLSAAPEKQFITVTEMVPRPDETWLIDAEGTRYTSEFRMVAVDQAERAAPEQPCPHRQRR